MKPLTRIVLVATLALGFCGCRQFAPTGARSNQPIFGNLGRNQGAFAGAPNQNQTQVAELQQRIRELKGQVGSFDTDNNGLHSEVASLRQQLQRSTEVNGQLRQQLGDMARSVQQLQLANNQNQQRLIQSGNPRGTPGQLVGSATVRANNSLLAKLPQIRVPGVQTRMDGDVIRIELPTDTVLLPGSFQINGSAQNMLSQIASSISQNFPNQYVGIEAHWDNTPLQGGMSFHQLTASQSLAMLNHFVSLGLPQQQMFTVGLANNRPRYEGSNTRNRRIEIVIFPESYRN